MALNYFSNGQTSLKFDLSNIFGLRKHVKVKTTISKVFTLPNTWGQIMPKHFRNYTPASQSLNFPIIFQVSEIFENGRSGCNTQSNPSA